MTTMVRCVDLLRRADDHVHWSLAARRATDRSRDRVDALKSLEFSTKIRLARIALRDRWRKIETGKDLGKVRTFASRYDAEMGLTEDRRAETTCEQVVDTSIRRERVLLGIDAGGSSTVARAVQYGRKIFDGVGGSGSPSIVDPAMLAANIRNATIGCTQPQVVAACIAGIGSSSGSWIVLDAIRSLFPNTTVRLAPDYLAPVLAERACNAVVIAGSGSVCCSLDDAGVHVSGGLGYLLGDQGSGYRYGRGLLAAVLDNPDLTGETVIARALVAAFGSIRRADILAAVYGQTNPVPAIATLAPVVAVCAADGMPWAIDLVDTETSALAGLAVAHVTARKPTGPLLIGLSGGLWVNPTFVDAFERNVAGRLGGRFEGVRLIAEPVEGALALAAMDDEQVDTIVWATRGPLTEHYELTGRKVIVDGD